VIFRLKKIRGNGLSDGAASTQLHFFFGSGVPCLGSDPSALYNKFMHFLSYNLLIHFPPVPRLRPHSQ